MDFLYNFSAEDLIPQSHPLRKIKAMADEVLRTMDGTFDSMYAEAGRPSIPPEFLLKASLLIAFYSIRSERQLCEQLAYNFLFRWFLDLMPNDPVPNHSTFAKNRERLLNQEIASAFLSGVVRFAQGKNLVSDDHFTADGTLIEAWASLKSFKPKKKAADEEQDKPADTSRNPTVNFHGEKRSNETHASTTDPEAMLARKGFGKEAKLSYCGNVIMENRTGLCVAALRKLKIKPHIAMIETRKTPGLDGRTTRSTGYVISQRVRKRIEELFGWAKTIGGIRKTRYRGMAKAGFHFIFTMAAADLVILAGKL